jgi:hypothetical protein
MVEDGIGGWSLAYNSTPQFRSTIPRLITYPRKPRLPVDYTSKGPVGANYTASASLSRHIRISKSAKQAEVCAALFAVKRGNTDTMSTADDSPFSPLTSALLLEDAPNTENPSIDDGNSPVTADQQAKYRSTRGRRAAWACFPCRKRKVRCNVTVEQPCLNCKHDNFDCYLSFYSKRSGDEVTLCFMVQTADVYYFRKNQEAAESSAGGLVLHEGENDDPDKPTRSRRRPRRPRRRRRRPLDVLEPCSNLDMPTSSAHPFLNHPFLTAQSPVLCVRSPMSPGDPMIGGFDVEMRQNNTKSPRLHGENREKLAASNVGANKQGADTAHQRSMLSPISEVAGPQAASEDRGDSGCSGECSSAFRCTCRARDHYEPFSDGLLKYLPDNAPYLNSTELSLLYETPDVCAS